MATSNITEKLRDYFEKQGAKILSCPYFQKIQAMPTMQRWAAFTGIFIGSQIVIFGALYLFFGEIVVVGFLASILAGLATGVGALPAIFFKDISKNLFNSLLGAAAGVMLAATAFSLLVPGIDYGNLYWP